MNKIIILSLFLVLIVVISGCTFNTADETSVSTEQEAGEALINVSTGVSDIETTLDDIDDLLS
jgi:peptidoglycan hydrolase CwlO-like protein